MIRNMLVSTVRDTGNKVVAYNFISYDTDSHKVATSTVKKEHLGQLKGKKIENIDIDAKGVVKGTNGAIDRYPAFVITNNGLTPVTHSLVVVSRLRDGFVVCDGNGRLGQLRSADATGYFKLQGIANGKLVKKDGKEVVSSIKGEYFFEDRCLEVKKHTDTKKAGTKTVTKAEEPKYSDEFYELIERAFGKNRAAIVKYLIENKKMATVEAFSDIINKAPHAGIAMVALAGIGKDALDGKTDETLIKITSTVVEKGAITATAKICKSGVKFFDFWGVNDDMYEDPDCKYDITAETVDKKIEAFKATKM